MLMAQRSDRTRCKVEENKKSESGRETFLADWEEAIHHWSFLNLAQNAGLQQLFKNHFSKLYLNSWTQYGKYYRDIAFSAPTSLRSSRLGE